MDEIVKIINEAKSKRHENAVKGQTITRNENLKWKLAEVIDTWYFSWKSRITDNNYPHKLGFAKEELKKQICELL